MRADNSTRNKKYPNIYRNHHGNTNNSRSITHMTNTVPTTINGRLLPKRDLSLSLKTIMANTTCTLILHSSHKVLIGVYNVCTHTYITYEAIPTAGLTSNVITVLKTKRRSPQLRTYMYAYIIESNEQF